MACDYTNFVSCFPEVFLDFILDFIKDLLNPAAQPMLDLIKLLLSEPVNIALFSGLWSVIIYIISLFFGLFFMGSGFYFLISGYDPVKRERAKLWLKNLVFMLIFIQASFFIYEIAIELSARMSSGIIEIIDPGFYSLTTDSVVNFGLQLFLLVPYLIVLLNTTLLLGLRYLVVSVGVVFLPIALFFYFFPPLNGYGRMLLNGLGVAVFIPFFDALILLVGSMLMDISIFSHIKVLVAMITFLTMDAFMICVLVFALVKSASMIMNSDVGKLAKQTVRYFA
ncbi:MAG: hypothetical protein ACE5FT_05670 [Candidatus Nanoarchaeia archaeon]